MKTTLKNSIGKNLAAVGLAALLASPVAKAANGVWAFDGSGIWSEATNWVPAGIPGTGADDVVGLLFDITGPSTVTIDDTNRVVGILNIGDTNAAFFPYTLTASGGASLAFETTGGNAQLNKPEAANTAADLVSAPLVLNRSLDLANGSTAGGTITISGPVSAGTAGTKTLANLGAGTAGITFSGAIANGSGTVAVVQNSTGSVLTLSGSNTYSGATTISAGTLKLQGLAFSAANRSYSIASGAVLNLDGGTAVATGTTIINGAGTLRISGGMLNNGVGAGRVIAMSLGAGGLIEVQAGATILNGGWQAINWVTNRASLTVDGSLDVWDGLTVIVDALNGSGTIDKGTSLGGTVTLLVGTNNGSGVFSGTIKNSSNFLGFTKSGTGTQVLAGTNAYTGTTTVNDGTLTLTASRTVAGGAVVVGNGGTATLNIQGDLPFAGNNQLQVGSTTTGIVNHSAGTVTFNAGNNLELLIGNGTGIPGHGTYNLSGSGVLNIGAGAASRGIMLGANSGVSAANPKIATFNMSGGTVNNANALMIVRGDAASSFFKASFTQTGGTASNQTLVVGGSGANGASSTAALSLTGGTFVATTFSSLSLGNSVTSTITIAGTADVTLGAFPTNRGTGSAADLLFDGGVLRPAAASTNYILGLTSAKILTGGAMFDVASGRDIVVRQNLLADLVSTGGGFTKAGSGVLTLTGTNTYEGATTVNAGTLFVSGPNTYAGPTVVNAGTLIESGALTYGSPTTINGGSLFVRGTSTVASGTGTFTVKTNGTLGGSGLIDLSAVNQSVVVENGGKVSPGSAAGAVGTLSLALGGGSLDLSAAAAPGTMVFALGATSASDKIVLNSGTLNIGSGLLNFASFNFQIVPGFVNATSTYTLIQSANLVGTLAGAGLSGTLANGMTATIALSGNDVVVNLSGVEGVTTQPLTWKGNLSGQWDNGSTNWVLTADGVTAAYYADGNAVTFDDSASGNTTVGGSPVLPGSVVVSNTTKSYALNSVIAGSTTVTKWGTNALTLAGSNTFTGGTTLNAGVLNINTTGIAGVSGPLGNGGTFTITGGTINNAGGAAITLSNVNPIAVGGNFAFTGSSALTLPGTVDLGGTNRIISANANTLTLGGSISNGALTKAGGGTLTLTGTSTYAGGTELNAGTLSTFADANLGSGGALTVNGTATWNAGINVLVTYNRSLTINDNAVLSVASGNNGKTITGALSGTGALVNTSTTGFDFPNTNNTFMGRVNNGYQMSFASLGDSTNAINLVGSNSRFVWNGAAKTFALRPFTLQNTFASAGNNPGRIDSSGSGALTVLQDLGITGPAGARTLELGGTNSGANTFAGTIANGTGAVVSLNKAGTGIWALSATNTYSGLTYIAEANPNSTLIFQGMQALSSNTTIQMRQNSTPASTIRLLDDGASAVGGVVSSPVPLLADFGNSVLNSSFFVGPNSVANGGNGAGTGTNLTIALGTLSFTLRSQAYSGFGSIQGNNGYKLQFNGVTLPALTTTTAIGGGSNWAARIVPTSASVILAGTIRQASGTALNGGSTTLQLDGTAPSNSVVGTIMDAADYPANTNARPVAVTKANSSVWTLWGSNTFSGGLTLSGTSVGSQLNINNPWALGPGTFTISGGNNGRFDNTSGSSLTNANNNAMNWFNDFTFVGTHDLDLGTGTVTLGGTRAITTTAGILTVGGPISSTNFGISKQGTGTLVLTGTNTYAGPTAVRLGTLQLGNGTAGNDGTISDTIAVTNNGQLVFNPFGTVTASYPIAGTGVVTKLGPGTVSLTAASSFSGPANINNGTLLLNGSIGNGAVTVASGGTLGGTGTIGGTVTSDGTVAPGESIGTLLVGGDYVQTTNGALNIELGSGSNDLLQITGTAQLAGTLNISLISGYVPQTNDSFVILIASSVTGDFAVTNLPSPGGGKAWDLQNVGNALFLTVIAAGGPPPPTGYDAFSNNFVLVNGPDGDDDGDGYANLYEYVTGSSPTNNGSGNAMTAVRTNGTFALKFLRDTNTVDATLIVEGSYTAANDATWIGFATNLAGSWGSSTNVIEDAGNPANVTAFDTEPAATNRFLRLRITRP